MSSTPDESFREIQLSGKQLVFLFMAATVVSVVIFLCGVLVGRGVRNTRVASDGGDGSALAAADVEQGRAVPAAAERNAGEPQAGAEKLTYAERLSATEPAAEQLRSAEAPPPVPEAEPASAPSAKPAPPAKPAPAAPASKPPVAPAEAKPAAAAPAPAAAKPAAVTAPAKAPTADKAPAAADGEPAGSGFSIQVAAIRGRADADKVAKRLAGKGYAAYVVPPTKAAPGVFRVRVGKFKDRTEAETVAARLEKEERFKPWILR